MNHRDADAGCTAVDVCAANWYLIVDNLYFPQSTQHCHLVRVDIEVDGGEHGHISIHGGLQKAAAPVTSPADCS